MPVIPVPAQFRFQPVDAREVAARLVELSLGLIDPVTQEPKVSFAVKERFSDRWTPLGIVEVA